MKLVLATFALTVLTVQNAQSQDYLGSFLGAESFGRQLERSQQDPAKAPPQRHDRPSKTETAPAETGSETINPYEGAKVANFAVADHGYGTPEFEKRGEIVDYVHGRDGKRVTLTSMGPNADGLSFAIRLPNGLMLDIEPQGSSLLVHDRSGKYRNDFVWRYEGPIEGRGTFCAACVDQKDAVAFVREHFMR